MKGKSTNQKPMEESKHPAFDDTRKSLLKPIAQFLLAASGCSDNSILEQALEQVIISCARDKQLKNTQSWSTNLFIRVFFVLQKHNLINGKKLNDFVTTFKQS